MGFLGYGICGLWDFWDLWGERDFGALPPPAEYVVRHWQDDAFFGAQFLSGVNPVLLRRCSRLPHNLALTPHMVAASVGPGTSLQKEMEEGRVFVADYALLWDLPVGQIGGEAQHVAAPLCLLWVSPTAQLLPIAIQVLPHNLPAP
ncbi:arachidonate 15-lipoxygenase B-like [Numida meleagris]|uniref:arachidonate 15-lipoxygenase B-like n=1 Tax=Numida meleagris TaxID=8996 RepID=UPI000B3DC4AE|nr:arachidonate 15-lipoxygenase B-like [Numida meleagris]